MMVIRKEVACSMTIVGVFTEQRQIKIVTEN
jgi:hypothetical protein